jgi:ATP-dependent Zn protease
MDYARLRQIIGTEDIVVLTPETMNLDFRYIKPLINRSMKVKYHEDNNTMYIARDNFNHINMSTNVIYEVTTPEKNQFCFFLQPGMFGFQSIFAFDKGKFFRIVKELKKISRAKIKQELEQNTRNINLPILDNTLIEDIERNSIGYLNTLAKYRHLNLKGCRGLIFTGPPGNGKTMLCRHLMTQAYYKGYTVRSYNGANIDKAYAENSLGELFESGNLIFFDDVDINYFSRSKNGKQSCSLLSAMDGLSKSHNCIRIFSTNEHIEDMDQAFLRPGRIDKIYKFNKPDGTLRKKFIQDWSYDEIQIDNLDDLVVKTDNFSFAELAELRNEVLLGKILYGNYDINNIISSMSNKRQDKKVGF